MGLTFRYAVAALVATFSLPLFAQAPQPPAPQTQTDAQKLAQVQRELLRVQSALVEARACLQSAECLQAKYQILLAEQQLPPEVKPK